MTRVTGSHLICKGLQTRGGEKYSCPGGDHILPVLDVMADQDFALSILAMNKRPSTWRMPGAASLSDPAFACTPRLVSPEDLEPALKRALAAGKPALLNVAVQRAISPRAEAAIGRRKAAASQ